LASTLSVLNLALLAGLVTLACGLAIQWEPAYPVILGWLPLAGSLSVCLTLALLAILAARWPLVAISLWRRAAWLVFAICAIGFVPFLNYWNLLGLALR
jgi:hypothetical protein